MTKQRILQIVVIVLMVALLTGALVYYNAIDKIPTIDFEEDSGDDTTDTPPGPDDDFIQPPTGNTVGKTCITYTMRNVFGSETTNISDLRGKVVVINFWGTWCGPCKAELPYFNQLASEYPDDVAVIAVHTKYLENTAGDYITTTYPDSKIIWTFDDTLSGNVDKYYTRLHGGTLPAYPMTVIVDARGVITHHTVKPIHSYDELKGYALEAMGQE